MVKRLLLMTACLTVVAAWAGDAVEHITLSLPAPTQNIETTGSVSAPDPAV